MKKDRLEEEGGKGKRMKERKEGRKKKRKEEEREGHKRKERMRKEVEGRDGREGGDGMREKGSKAQR